MKQLLLRVSICLVLFLTSQAASAQSPWSWQYRYGDATTQSCQQVLPLKAGGYLLMGKSNPASLTSTNLYLVRTDAAGQQLWTQTHTIPDCSTLYILPACENTAGQVLVSLRAATENMQGVEPTVAGLLLLLQPDGTVAWQKRTATYPLRPAVGGSVPVPYSRAVLDASGNFLLAQNTPTETSLLQLDATGQQLRQLAFPMPAETLPTGNPASAATIYDIVPLAGGLVAYVVSSVSARLVEVSEQGAQGRTTMLPPVQIANQPAQVSSRITDFVALPNNDVLLVAPDQLARVQLYSGTVRWNNTSYSTLQMTPQRAAQLPDGKLLLFGTIYQTHTYQVVLRVFDEAGRIFMGGTPNPVTGLPTPLQYSFGSGMKTAASGLFFNSTTRELVAGGSLQDTPTQEQAFLLRSAPLAALFPSIVTTTAASQLPATAAWPNPVGPHDQLTVSADFAQASPLALYDLQGRRVRSWPKPVGTSERRLSLQNLPAGLYLLRRVSTGGTPATLRIVKE
jgi:Secretion system C-terminal sorting domain